MDRRREIAIIALTVVAVIVAEGFGHFGYTAHTQTSSPKTLNTAAVNKITGQSWTTSQVISSNSKVNSFTISETSGWYSSPNANAKQSMAFWIFQCSNKTALTDLLHAWYKSHDNLSFGTNLTKEGNVSYNYTMAYLNGSPLYSQISAYYKNFYILFFTPPDGSGPILNKTVMLNVLNAQIKLLNDHTSYSIDL